jgi:hypothetical protein
MFDLKEFLKDNSTLFTACNLFIVISLYLTNYLNGIQEKIYANNSTIHSSSIQTNDYIITSGWSLVLLSCIMAYLIFNEISANCLNNRNEELEIRLFRRIKIHESDPKRFSFFILIQGIMFLFYLFILIQAKIPFSPIIAIFFVTLLNILNLTIYSKKSLDKSNIGKFMTEEKDLKLFYHDLKNCYDILLSSANPPLEILQMFVKDILEYQNRQINLSKKLEKNLFFYNANFQPEDEKCLKVRLLKTNLMIFKIILLLSKNLIVLSEEKLGALSKHINYEIKYKSEREVWLDLFYDKTFKDYINNLTKIVKLFTIYKKIFQDMKIESKEEEEEIKSNMNNLHKYMDNLNEDISEVLLSVYPLNYLSKKYIMNP